MHRSIHMTSYLCKFAEATTKCKQLTNDPRRCWLFLSDTKQTWGGATQNCISFGGNLAIEYDLDLHNAIAKEVASYGREHNWWIGVRGNDHGHWTWNTGSHISKHLAVLQYKLHTFDRVGAGGPCPPSHSPRYGPAVFILQAARPTVIGQLT